MVSVATFFNTFSILHCIVIVAIEGLEDLVSVQQPFGIRMCSSMCLSFDTCCSLSFDKQQLRCFLESTNMVSGRLFHLMRKDIDLNKTLSWDRKGANSDYTHLSIGNTHLYVKQHDEIKTWGEALQVCQTERGTLVKVDSKVKHKLLTKAFYSHPNEYLWIGLADNYDNDTWSWRDGTLTTDYHNWGMSEPDNFYGGKAENCAAMTYIPIFGVRWCDVYCHSHSKFLCEKNHHG